MKTTKISAALTILLVTGALALTSCKKKTKEVVEEQVADTEQSSATDNALSESTAQDIESMGSEASENATLTALKGTENAEVTLTDGLTAASCASITLNPTAKTITIDFGTSCVGNDGKTRSGKLIYNFSGSAAGATAYRNPGFSMNVTSQNYVVDNYSVNIINKTITNTTPPGAPAGTNLTWSISANIAIAKPGGGNITWTCSRTKELTNTSDSTCYKGQNTYIRWNRAIVKLNGTASGSNASGESYTSVATNLIRSFQCAPEPVLHPHLHPFIGGTLAYTPGTRYQRVINYGNGTDCDFNATITINGVTYNVTLK